MNCPGHILIYKDSLKSYRDLPVRLGELGTVYRYERSGVMHGLMRVRGFTQDDATSFARPNRSSMKLEAVSILRSKYSRISGSPNFRPSFPLGIPMIARTLSAAMSSGSWRPSRWKKFLPGGRFHTRRFLAKPRFMGRRSM